MPIENERKYVLLPSMEEEFKDRSIYYRVEQGYVQNAAEGFQIRFRKAEHYIGHKKVDTKRIFTLKSKNCDFTSTEIEVELSEDDFNALWPKVHQSLAKTRYKIKEDDLCWEIDIFHGEKGNYFWMAEIELPGKQEWPPFVPNYIEKHLLYKVPLTDHRFSSRKLSDKTYANNLFDQIVKEQER
tara:strand:+ start:25307 stop:25858 length:552 start_codon:yes stop_codon:yes gene_type:complete